LKLECGGLLPAAMIFAFVSACGTSCEGTSPEEETAIAVGGTVVEQTAAALGADPTVVAPGKTVRTESEKAGGGLSRRILCPDAGCLQKRLRRQPSKQWISRPGMISRIGQDGGF
jgi:hypothetical protein